MRRTYATAAMALAALTGCGDNQTGDDGGNETTSSTSSSSSTTTTGGGKGGGTPSTCDNLVGKSFALNDIASDWALPDHLGATANLHQFCGRPVYLEIGSIW